MRGHPFFPSVFFTETPGLHFSKDHRIAGWMRVCCLKTTRDERIIIGLKIEYEYAAKNVVLVIGKSWVASDWLFTRVEVCYARKFSAAKKANMLVFGSDFQEDFVTVWCELTRPRLC
jgi:hypothetical protein